VKCPHGIKNCLCPRCLSWAENRQYPCVCVDLPLGPMCPHFPEETEDICPISDCGGFKPREVIQP
jgi:hypothetical protein